MKRHFLAGVGALVLGLAGLTACAGDDANEAAAARLRDGGAGADWAGFGGTYGEQHFSPLAEISDGNIGQLGLAWFIDLPPGNSVSSPIAIDGILYYTTGYSVVHAADASTGKGLWTYDPKSPEAAPEKMRTSWGSRGLAWWDGKLYVGTQDGRLIAIDAQSGKELWSVMTVDPRGKDYVTGAPRVFGGKVIIGFGGADVGPTRGYVTTYDAVTGKKLWRFYTVPGDPAEGFENDAMAMAAKTWAGEWWKFGGGGTVWNAISYDEESDTVFIGVGNGAPWSHKLRSQGRGDNLFLASIVALDGKTGNYKWHYQTNPGETWDYTTVMDMALAELEINGKTRKVLMTAPKNGFLYIIDRNDGKLISADPIAKVTWASKIDLATGRPVENPLARYPNGTSVTVWPSTNGAHGWYPMAYSPRSRLVYIPVLEGASVWTDDLVSERVPGWKSGARSSFAVIDNDPLNRTSRLDAWDPVTRKRVWSQPTPGLLAGGVMATGGNLVFQGQLDGKFNAYLAGNGKLVWSFDAKAPILAPPISYTVAGRQYVTVMTGASGSRTAIGKEFARFDIDYRTQARRVLTFMIGGKGVLPPRSPSGLKPIDDPDYRADAMLADKGAATYGRCAACHGRGAVAGGAAPDLRASAVPLDPGTFRQIVKDGGLVASGMPRFSELTDEQLHQLRQFLRAQAAEWRRQQRTTR